jgi:preprotein translocase YajC subunit
MTHLPALLHLFAATSTKKPSGSSSIFLILLLVVAVVGYFFFIKPQQRKAQAARAGQGADIEVGDTVQTIGGVIGTVLEIHGDRYTLLTGHLGQDGNLDGPQPTRIVFIRPAIAKKVDLLVEADDDMDVGGSHVDVPVEDETGPGHGDGHDGHDAHDAEHEHTGDGEAEEA